MPMVDPEVQRNLCRSTKKSVEKSLSIEISINCAAYLDSSLAI